MTGAPAFAAADWGTTRLRVWTIDAGGGVVAERRSDEGLLAAQPDRFAGILERVLADMGAPSSLPVAICGMAGARQGWIEAPYATVPASLEAIFAASVAVPGTARDIRIVPGLAQRDADAPDVMRGEETQVFGALTRIGLADGLVVLPGTHSKWARVTAGRIVAFRTFLTGEMFGLLRRHSILGRLMPAEDEDAAVPNSAFEDGCAVSAGAAGSLLHDLFSVRTHGLFGHKPASDLAGYMSGLLIGEEIREATALEDAIPPSVHLIGAPALAALYRRALAVFGIDGEVVAGEASIAGLHAVARARGLI